MPEIETGSVHTRKNSILEKLIEAVQFSQALNFKMERKVDPFYREIKTVAPSASGVGLLSASEAHEKSRPHLLASAGILLCVNASTGSKMRKMNTAFTKAGNKYRNTTTWVIVTLVKEPTARSGSTLRAVIG